jgi:hypothetical protein
MEIEQVVPRARFASPATRQQISLGCHASELYQFQGSGFKDLEMLWQEHTRRLNFAVRVFLPASSPANRHGNQNTDENRWNDRQRQQQRQQRPLPIQQIQIVRNVVAYGNLL